MNKNMTTVNEPMEFTGTCDLRTAVPKVWNKDLKTFVPYTLRTPDCTGHRVLVKFFGPTGCVQHWMDASQWNAYALKRGDKLHIEGSVTKQSEPWRFQDGTTGRDYVLDPMDYAVTVERCATEGIAKPFPKIATPQAAEDDSSEDIANA